jgi:hypothetical protein
MNRMGVATNYSNIQTVDCLYFQTNGIFVESLHFCHAYDGGVDIDSCIPMIGMFPWINNQSQSIIYIVTKTYNVDII